MKKAMMMLGAVLAWAVGGFAATHEGVQLWENGPLWAKTNVGANSPTETGYYFWWGDTLGYKWQNNQWVASDGSKSGYSFSASTSGKTLDQLQSMGLPGRTAFCSRRLTGRQSSGATTGASRKRLSIVT